MFLTKSLLTKSDRNKGIQKVRKKVLKSERRALSHRGPIHEKVITRQGPIQIIRCKPCFYHSSGWVINISRLVLSNKCPECMSENLEYYTASTSKLLEYILNNIN